MDKPQNAIPEIYDAPEFASCLDNIPLQRVKLGNFPTPIQPWTFSWKGETYKMLIKRDDLSDLCASGNKIRKLEFILPEVLDGKHDWILSFGPFQSNSCRVISVVAPRIGLHSAHVLIKNSDVTHTAGNHFFHQLFCSQLFLVSREEFLKKGEEKLLEEAKSELMMNFGAQNPYIIPMGGSTGRSIFGYIECFRELASELEATQTMVDEIFFASGSGGTAAGLAIGKFLSPSPELKNVKLTGYIAWDSTPEHFHHHVNQMLMQIGLDSDVKSEDLVRFVSACGLGYGESTKEEIDMIKAVANSSGIVLDGTYTGKALFNFIKEGRPIGQRTLFLHTGGLFSMMSNDWLS